MTASQPTHTVYYDGACPLCRSEMGVLMRDNRAGLLRYLVSFRDHAEFHEQCVERIFIDLMARCRPRSLSVQARYTRRGGLDINPWRATAGLPAPVPLRDPRQ